MKVTLHELIEQGGFADVWRGEDELSRKVAVKIVRPASEGISDALDHARVLARAEHGNVVRVYSIEDVDDPERKGPAKGIVMEFLSGQTFEVFQNATSSLDLAQARRLGEGLLAGLTHIHGCGLAHGDLHKKNVMICGDGTLKIIDIIYRCTLRDLSTMSRDEQRQRDITGSFVILKEILTMAGVRGQAMWEFASSYTDGEESLPKLREAFVRAVTPSPVVALPPQQTLQPTPTSQAAVVQLIPLRFSGDNADPGDFVSLTVAPLAPLDLLLDRAHDTHLRKAIQAAYGVPPESMQALRRDADALHIDYEDDGMATTHPRRWRLLASGGLRVITRSLHQASTDLWLAHLVSDALAAMRFARQALAALGCAQPVHVLHQLGVERGTLRLGTEERRAVGLPGDSRGERRGNTTVSAHQRVLPLTELPSNAFLAAALVVHLRSMFAANPDVQALGTVIENTD